MRSRIAGLLCAALEAALAAQAPEPAAAAIPGWTLEQTRKQLASTAPEAVATAAVRAAEAGFWEATPALRSALRRCARQGGEESLLCRIALVDALVQLNASLSLSELQQHDAQALRPGLLVLAARDAEANRDYLLARFEATDAARNLEWRACGNLLAAARDPVLPMRCLQSISYMLVVTVRDDQFRYRGLPPAAPQGHLAGTLPPQFPRIHLVRLAPANEDARGARLRTVAHLRQPLHGPLQFSIPACDPQLAFRAWLTEYGRDKTGSACRADLAVQQTAEHWRSDQQLRKLVAAARNDVERAFAAMTAELAATGAVRAADVARIQPGFVLRLVDERGDPGRRPLPAASDLLRR